MTTPFVMISYTDDMHTFSHEIKVPLVGSDKNYLTRIRLFGLGSSYSRIIRLVYSDKSSYTLVSMHGDVEFGI